MLYSLCWCSASSFLPSLRYLSFYARIHSVISWLVLFSLSGFILVHPLIQQSSSSKAVLISNNFWLEIWFPTSSSLWLICQQVASHNIPYRHRSLEPTGTGLRHSSVIWSAHNTSFRQVMANHRGKKTSYLPSPSLIFLSNPLWYQNSRYQMKMRIIQHPVASWVPVFPILGLHTVLKEVAGKTNHLSQNGQSKGVMMLDKKLSPGVLAYNKDMQDWLVSVHQGIHVLPGTPNNHF